MIIGVFSDTHDDTQAIDQAVEIFVKRQVELIIHCGDWVKPDVVKHLSNLAEKYSIPVKGVLGNNDHELATIIENRSSLGDSIEFPSSKVMELEIEGKQAAIYHGEDKPTLDALVECRKYQLIFTGHTHRVNIEQTLDTLIINPGAVALSFFGQPSNSSTLVIYDTNQAVPEIITLS